jgi:hypothetical protein
MHRAARRVMAWVCLFWVVVAAVRLAGAPEDGAVRALLLVAGVASLAGLVLLGLGARRRRRVRR